MEASSELNNQKCQSAPLQKVNEKIKDSLRDMLNRKEIKRLWTTLLKKQLVRFCPLSKIHKRRLNLSGRPVISNNGSATENISSFRIGTSCVSSNLRHCHLQEICTILCNHFYGRIGGRNP